MNLISKIILSCFFTALLFSCSSDDDNNTAPQTRSEVEVPNTISIPIPSINLSDRPSRLNFRITGSSANELLSDAVYKSVTLELVSVQGFEPSQEAIDHLVQFIKNRTHKSNGVQVISRTIPAPANDNDTYSTGEIANIEIDNRTTYSTVGSHSIYIFFADKEHEESEGSSVILGTAYRNTSLVIYERTLKRITERLPTALNNVEAGVLLHEYCHLLGLVNNGTPLQSPHEEVDIDEDGNEIGGHCNVPNCLMQSRANFMRNMMNSVDILELDALCIKDLQANGGK